VVVVVGVLAAAGEFASGSVLASLAAVLAVAPGMVLCSTAGGVGLGIALVVALPPVLARSGRTGSGCRRRCRRSAWGRPRSSPWGPAGRSAWR
jgi:hypothetical protein